jgi:hypothetical protein
MNDIAKKKINPALWIVQLLGLWSRISQIHLGLGASCQCASNMPGIAVTDLELNIMEYLNGKYQRDAEFTQWLGLHTQDTQELKTSVTTFLKTMATHTPSRALALKVLQDLQLTLESLQQAHPGR